ncbi:MAG TPA: hypothetical protein VFB96_05025 [Pirellulaceae bacterium]|nr:hypothetical protein [Pirellulaceae bacterium]
MSRQVSLFLRVQHLAAMAAALLCVQGPVGAPADAAEPLAIEIRHVEIGFGGTYKSGFWAPIWLTVRSPQNVRGVLEVLAPDGDGAPAAFSSLANGQESDSTFHAGEDETICVYAKIGPQQGVLSARLRDAETNNVLWQERLPTSAQEPLPAKWELVVSLGESSATVDAAEQLPHSEDHRIVAAAVTDANRVPEVWWGWEGVATIVLSTGPGSIVSKLSPAQFAALKQWVEIGGGRLVVCVGERGQDVLAADSPLVAFVPGKLVEVAPLRDLARLEELTGQPPLAAGDTARPRVARLTEVHGRVEATITGLSGEVPLLVRNSHGNGELVFLGVDCDGTVMENWPGRGRLLAAAMNDPANTSSSDAPGMRGGSRLGYDDLVGQLRMAMDHFPNVRVINITTVALLTLGYLVLIGPIDFLIQRHIKWPSPITWFSFPLLIVAFCAVGWFVRQAAHGSVARANLAEVIDVDVDRQAVRGTAWIHLYGNQTSTHDVSLAVQGAPVGLTGSANGWLTWQGLPGSGLGGLAANQIGAPQLAPYAISSPGPQMTLTGLPLQIAGSKSMSALWWGATGPLEKSALTLNQYDLLEGEIVNPLPVDLDSCLLVFDEWLYRLKSLSPGQRVRLSDFDPLNLEARLQQRTIANAKDVVSPWEADSVDVPRIMQMIMFHESARGRSYTNLTHLYQGYLDMTPRVRNGRAILVGRIAQGVTQLSVDGKPLAAGSQAEPWTWVRLVLPVAKRGQP